MSDYYEIVMPGREMYVMADAVQMTDHGELILSQMGKDGIYKPIVILAPGNWFEVYAASMIDGSEIGVEHVFRRRPDSNREKIKVPNSLRLKVFERDGWKCRICGKTRDDGALLEADHIIPVSEGGQTKIENLQTLCRECNNGKGKRILNSFPGND